MESEKESEQHVRAKNNSGKFIKNREHVKINNSKKEKVKFYPTKVSQKSLEGKEVEDLLNLYKEVKGLAYH